MLSWSILELTYIKPFLLNIVIGTDFPLEKNILKIKKSSKCKKEQKGEKSKRDLKLNINISDSPLSGEGKSPIWEASMFAKAWNSLNSDNWSSEVISSAKQKTLSCFFNLGRYLAPL